MVLPRNESSLDALLNAMLLNDPDPQVRLAALLALSEMPSLAEAGAAVFAMLQDPRNSEDRWIPDAAVAAARHDAGFLKAVLSTYKPAAVESSKASLANLIPNSSFEEQNGAGPAVGGPRPTAGAGNLGSPRRPHGRGSAKISSNRAEMSVGPRRSRSPRTDYHLTGWIKTENVQKVGRANGAMLNIHELQDPFAVAPSPHGRQRLDAGGTELQLRPNDASHGQLPVWRLGPHDGKRLV